MKLKLNLSNRVSLGYTIIIFVAVVATSFCIWTLQGNKRIDARIQTIDQPLYLALKNFGEQIDNSQKLISNWVFQPNGGEKKDLKAIQEITFPKLKENVNKILTDDSENTSRDIQTAMNHFTELISVQQKLMNTSSADSLYLDAATLDKGISIVNTIITPQTTELRKNVDELLKQQEQKISLGQKEKQAAYSKLMVWLIVMVLIFIVAAGSAYWYANNSIVKPIQNLKDVVLEIGQGKVVQAKFEERADEIGEMTTAITTLMKGINNKSTFALEIGKGNYREEFKLMSEHDAMGKALLDMRESLKLNAEEESKRNWVTQGLAKFVDILRVNNDDIEELAAHIISSLVKYMEANQGALFILNDRDPKDRHLEMVACYAYNRKKFLEKRIAIGEGLTGQAFLEKETIYLKEVPKDFVTITSGLGEALPKHVLIVPLKINEEIYGIVEIASFSEIQPYRIEFVEKLGESIASTISNVKTNDQTKSLLIETQSQTEQMRAQEEEMRQNMEELKATQEEVVRRQEEANKLLQKFELVTMTTTEGLWDMEVPKGNDIHDNTPFYWSDRFRKMLGFQSEKDFPNVLHSWSDLLHLDHKQNTLNAFSEHLFDLTGKTPYDVEYQLKLKDGSYRWFRAVGNTVRDDKGNPLRVAGSLIDIQGLKDIQELQRSLEEKVKSRTAEMQEVLASAQQKNEELSAQEEEIRQNLEEIQATQEAMIRKQEEIDKARAENERIREEESQRAIKVSEMQKKSMLAATLKLKNKVEEMQRMKEEMERLKEQEAQRSLRISEMQKQTMNKIVNRLKAAENELRYKEQGQDALQ